jgi:sugar lactone lactonase YvrE
MFKRTLALLATAFALTASAQSTSYYPLTPKDPEALTLRLGHDGLKGDGKTDDSEALQSALNKLQETPRHQGILFLPSGTYRITRTLYLWPGIRVLGVGPTRPVITLAPNTPGYQQGEGLMLFFVGGRRGDGRGRQGDDTPFPATVPPTPHIIDGNPGTFYSAMANVDIEIGEGNPAAVGIRFHIAQHAYLAHMDFRLGTALAGIHDAGNEAEDLHFHGGQYGIITRKPSPGWQFTLLDSTFDGQSLSAIKEHEAGLTLVRNSFKDVPHAIMIDPTYGEELWVKESRFENISGAALVIANPNNARTEINLEDVVASNTPVLAEMLETNERVKAPAPLYNIKRFTHGLVMKSMTDPGRIETILTAEKLTSLPAPLPPAIKPLPAQSTWVNIRDLGAKGDAKTDDTAVFQKAIAEHQAIYVPEGYYLVSDTLALRPDTALIALHPSRTQIFIADGTPTFNGTGAPRALVSAPSGGTNILSGIGLSTNGQNNLAIGILWKAGADSLVSDTRLLGGHGTQSPDGGRYDIYDANHSGDPNPKRKWDSQYPSIWVTDGGGGTFSNIWTPNTFAQAGLYISNTETPGRVYELSSEHHVRNEIKLDHAANWGIYSLQTEEERGEGGICLPIEIANSHDITFATFHSYRVVSMYQPFYTTVKVSNSHNIHFRAMHIYSDSKASFDNAVVTDTGLRIRQREIGALDITGTETRALSPAASTLTAGPVQKLDSGFYNISGAAVDPKGQLYFTDFHTQHIYRWNAAKHATETVRDNPAGIVNLAFDKAGNMLAVSYDGNGTVYSMRPEDPMGQMRQIKATPSIPQPGKTAVIALDYWHFENDILKTAPVLKPWQFVSPDGTTFIPAGDDFIKGSLYYGIKMHDIVRAFGLAQVPTGKRMMVSDEAEHKTWSVMVNEDGHVSDLQIFAQRGGESLATDAAGNVYVGDGQIFVYSPAGKELGAITVPDRPIDILFGGADKKTLFILARNSLYSVRMK